MSRDAQTFVSFLRELKRRRVVRVLLVYLASGFAVMAVQAVAGSGVHDPLIGPALTQELLACNRNFGHTHPVFDESSQQAPRDVLGSQIGALRGGPSQPGLVVGHECARG